MGCQGAVGIWVDVWLSRKKKRPFMKTSLAGLVGLATVGFSLLPKQITLVNAGSGTRKR